MTGFNKFSHHFYNNIIYVLSICSPNIISIVIIVKIIKSLIALMTSLMSQTARMVGVFRCCRGNNFHISFVGPRLSGEIILMPYGTSHCIHHQQGNKWHLQSPLHCKSVKRNR